MKHFIFLVLSLQSFLAAAEVKQASISGAYTYRSFHNLPGLTNGEPDKVSKLIFGEGNLSIEIKPDNTVAGKIEFGGNYGLDISGTYEPSTVALNLRGTGRLNTPTAGWTYDYKAIRAPQFKDTINPRLVLLGTVLRAVSHGGSLAGYSASFTMIHE